jgi:four helix bundle protein
LELIKSHKEIRVYQIAFQAALEIYELSKTFPVEERYSLTDQIRRSSRSVCANLAEAFRKRRYQKAFIAKLSDSEGEAAETQVWLEFCFQHKYIDQKTCQKLYDDYENVISKLVLMINNPDKWSIL